MSLRIDVTHQVGDFQLSVAVTAGHGLTALVGPSGAGKTTMLNIIAGVVRPDRGVVALDDEVLVDTARRIWQPPHTRHIGYVFQTPRLFPHLTVQSNLTYGRRRSAENGHQFVFDEVVALLDLQPLLARTTRRLSGGEAQRVALGRALLSQPRLLLLDEPLASVDQARRDEILPYLDRLRSGVQLPLIYVTHSPADVENRAEQTLVLDRGRLRLPAAARKN